MGALKKMRLAGVPTRLINADADRRTALGEGLAEASGEPAAVVLFAAGRADLEAHLPAALEAAAGDRLLWVLYPKGGRSDFNRDTIFAHLQSGGTHLPVSSVAVDERWSALRVRPVASIKSARLQR